MVTHRPAHLSYSRTNSSGISPSMSSMVLKEFSSASPLVNTIIIYLNISSPKYFSTLFRASTSSFVNLTSALSTNKNTCGPGLFSSKHFRTSIGARMLSVPDFLSIIPGVSVTWKTVPYLGALFREQDFVTEQNVESNLKASLSFRIPDPVSLLPTPVLPRRTKRTSSSQGPRLTSEPGREIASLCAVRKEKKRKKKKKKELYSFYVIVDV